MSNEADARMSYRYMPIMGEFETSAELIVFKGRPIEAPKSAQPNQEAAAESPQPQVAESVGILISDHKMINGVLRATVKFSEITLFSVCEIIVNYDTRTKSHISAGLGGTGMMFSIRQWVPAGATQPVGAWNNLELAGVRSNLQCDVPYDLAVQTEGSIISLEVNGVQVLTTTLPFGSSQANPTGIFCVSKSDITVSNFTAKNEDPKAFIVMQFRRRMTRSTLTSLRTSVTGSPSRRSERTKFTVPELSSRM
jgi:hypothetical protein